MESPQQQDPVEQETGVQAPNVADKPNKKGAKKHSPLPLGWTQVKRRRRHEPGSSDEVEWCCDDPLCPRPSNKQRAGEMPTSTNSDNKNGSVGEVLRGQAIICLHDIDASWFQGQFLPKDTTKPLGLLGVQEVLDECLECADGGYRRVTLTLVPRSNKKVSWKHVEWTGGDMMRLDGGDDISMETQRMWTGAKAVPYMEKYFGSILKKLQNGADESRSVLELLPNVAIVTGPMRITLPEQQDDTDA